MEIELNIHETIKKKLNFFIENKKIPNILFHGPCGSGKRTLVYNFVDKIYTNKELKQNYVLFVNCAQGKGIKFIREDLKFFAKTHINFANGNLFKTIILSNADKLTIDAQSALRRCIEQFSHTTRFIIIVEDKYKLLKPILSRFSEIYVALPLINNKTTNLHSYKIINDESNKLFVTIKRVLHEVKSIKDIPLVTIKLYNKGITGLDIINYIDKTYKSNLYKYQLLACIGKIKKEIRNELLLLQFIINLLTFRSDKDLENILEM
tara:strand:+ start:13373 stop:14164 length:792 start_codon:yes stop_codon:yes gene_type:complete